MNRLRFNDKYVIIVKNKTNFYKVELYSVKVRDREGMGKGQVRDG